MLNQKLRFECLQKRAKNRVSVSGKVTEICVHGIVNYSALSCLCFFFQNPRQTLKSAFFLGVGGQQKTHYK